MQAKQPIIIDQYPYEDYEGEDDLPDSEDYQGYDPLYAFPEDEMETVHVYGFREQPPFWNKDRITAAMMGFFALALILAFCFIPSGQSYTLQTISVPAQFSMQQFKAVIAIQPTGKKEYPATKAEGTLTIYNGSFLVQQLPAGLIVTASNGQEFAIDQAVTIPAADLPSLGVASVSAHALVAGSSGNIPVKAIQATYGSSLKIKNLAAFSGGQDAYTKTYATDQDKAAALTAARQSLAIQKYIGLQPRPCVESTSQHDLTLTVIWACQYALYQLPRSIQPNQVVSVSIQGDRVFLVVKVAPHVITNHFAK